jgi:hypothetical protein
MTHPAPIPAPRRRMALGAMSCVALLYTAACGAPLMKLPKLAAAAGASIAPDAVAAFDEATAACRKISGFSAEIAVKGSIGGRRIRARLLAGLSAPSSVRLEAFAGSVPIFFFVARGREATLVIPPPDDRVLSNGPADQVLEAVTGLRVAPDDLRATLTGCAPATAAVGMRAVGDEWRVGTGEVTSYLHRDHPGGPWRLVATIRKDTAGVEWRAEFRDFAAGLPSSVRLTSSVARRFDLSLALSQVDTAASLDDEAFRLQIRPTARAMTLEELRDAGPLGAPAK